MASASRSRAITLPLSWSYASIGFPVRRAVTSVVSCLEAYDGARDAAPRSFGCGPCRSTHNGRGYRPSASDRLGWPSDGAPWSSDPGREPARHRHARRPSLRPRSVFFPGRRSYRLNMIPNGDLGKGFGLRASLELDKHPEGQRSEVVAKCLSGKKSDVIMGWPAMKSGGHRFCVAGEAAILTRHLAAFRLADSAASRFRAASASRAEPSRARAFSVRRCSLRLCFDEACFDVSPIFDPPFTYHSIVTLSSLRKCYLRTVCVRV